LLHVLYCAVLVIVATVVSLIDSLGGVVRKLSNKRRNIPLDGKKYDIVVSLNSDMRTNVEKLAKDFDIPTTTLTTVSQNKNKIISPFFVSEIRENTMQ